MACVQLAWHSSCFGIHLGGFDCCELLLLGSSFKRNDFDIKILDMLHFSWFKLKLVSLFGGKMETS